MPCGEPQPGVSLRVGDQVVFHDLDGEVVLLNLETGVYFGLDPVGSRIWSLIDGRRTTAQVVTAIVEEYDVDAPTCETDVARLVASLRSHGLLVPDGAPAR
jgi:hypothetical protein